MTDTEIARRKAICDVAGVKDIGEVSDGFHTFNGLYAQRMILFAALVKAYKTKAWKSYRHEDGNYCFGGGWFVVGIDTPEGNYTYHYENKYWNMFDCVDLPRAPHWDGHTEADAETRLMSLEPEIKTDGDTISRQMAIDALQKEINKGIPPFDDVMGSIRCGVRLARNIIEDLPSAQPQYDEEWRKKHYETSYNQGYVDGYKMCEKRLPRWIPCSERLPEYGHPVLWCNEKGSVFISAITYQNGHSWNVGKRHRRCDVVAWMPIPEPYKGGD